MVELSIRRYTRGERYNSTIDRLVDSGRSALYSLIFTARLRQQVCPHFGCCAHWSSACANHIIHDRATIAGIIQYTFARSTNIEVGCTCLGATILFEIILRLYYAPRKSIHAQIMNSLDSLMYTSGHITETPMRPTLALTKLNACRALNM